MIRKSSRLFHHGAAGLSLVFAGLLVFAASASPVRADVITLRADDWCPYNCDPASDKPGYIIEIAKIVFEAAGHRIDYKLMPWTRTLEEVQKGAFDGAVGANAGDSPTLIYSRTPIGVADNGFIFKKGLNFTYKDVSSLDPYRIAVVQGVSFDDEIDAYLKKHSGKGDRVQINTGEDVGLANLKKLLLGRVDLIVDNPYVLTYTVKRLKAEDKVSMVRTNKPTDIFIGFSPKNPKSQDYAELLSVGIETLRKSGKLAKILAAYGVEDWAAAK